MITYPSPKDYVAAVQEPAKAFTSPELRSATFAVDRQLGVPRPGTGSSAVVFKANIHGRDEALRFFTRDDASSLNRYRALSRHIKAKGLADCVAGSSWEEEAITVNGRTWPLVRMEWIEGRPLDRYTDALVERSDTVALAGLAQEWRRMVKRLQDAEFAHGDLQHGNVFVDQACRLRLVDLDGCWVPSLGDEKPPSEQGHPNYQRPSRQWDRWMDTFPSLVVYLSLMALSRNPASWDDLYVEDNLLFEKNDFSKPYETDVWRRLDTLQDGEIRALAKRLRECCDPSWPATGTLEQLLVRRWWEETTATAPPPAPVAPIPRPLPRPPDKTIVPPRAVPPPRVGPPPVPGVPVGAAARRQRSWWEQPPPGRAPAPAPSRPGMPAPPAAPPRPRVPAPRPAPAPAGRPTPSPVPRSAQPAKPGKAGANIGWSLVVAVLIGVFSTSAGTGVAFLVAAVTGVIVFGLLMFFRP